MRTIQAQTAIEDNFEQEGVLSEDETPEILDIDASESGGVATLFSVSPG